MACEIAQIRTDWAICLLAARNDRRCIDTALGATISVWEPDRPAARRIARQRARSELLELPEDIDNIPMLGQLAG